MMVLEIGGIWSAVALPAVFSLAGYLHFLPKVFLHLMLLFMGASQCRAFQAAVESAFGWAEVLALDLW
jgi:hypothetical protein